jgi:hypothetical protein
MKKLDIGSFKSDYEYEKAKRKVKKDALNSRNLRNKGSLWGSGSSVAEDTEMMYYESFKSK